MTNCFQLRIRSELTRMIEQSLGSGKRKGGCAKKEGCAHRRCAFYGWVELAVPGWAASLTVGKQKARRVDHDRNAKYIDEGTRETRRRRRRARQKAWEKAEKRDATISTKYAKFRRFSGKMQSVGAHRVLLALLITAVITSIAGKLQPGECANVCDAERVTSG